MWGSESMRHSAIMFGESNCSTIDNKVMIEKRKKYKEEAQNESLRKQAKFIICTISCNEWIIINLYRSHVIHCIFD